LFCRNLGNGVGGGEGCVEPFGLQAAKFFQRPVEGALGCRAGAIDRDLETVDFFVRQILGWSYFEIGAAPQTPGGMNDFASEGLFERRVGREFSEIAGFELIKDVAFFGADEVRDREETEFGGILRDAGSPFGRDRAVGSFGILPICEDLGCGGHEAES